MEFIVIIVVLIIAYLIIAILFGANLKTIKHIAEDEKLDKIADKYPSNKEICKEILKKLNNEAVKIEEDTNASTTLYLVTGNKIFIANLKQNFTRIQTIAHECLHSIQSKKILWTNFVFSNIYLIFFMIISALAVLKKLPNKNLFLIILIICGFVYYVIRSYLENDAMTKARFLAKEYMQEKNICSKEEINEVISRYDELNRIGIKATNFQLFQSIIIKTLIFTIICLIF